jgi:uncharacterized membrane protein YvlD (DUF360 family)
MKRLLRVFLFHIFALWLVTALYGGLVIQGGVLGIFTAGAVLSLLMLIVKPVLKILFIPVNFITFGLANWCINITLLFLLTLVLPEVIVREYTFAGLSWQGFVIPSVKFTYILSLILSSIGITFVVHLLYGISES